MPGEKHRKQAPCPWGVSCEAPQAELESLDWGTTPESLGRTVTQKTASECLSGSKMTLELPGTGLEKQSR